MAATISNAPRRSRSLRVWIKSVGRARRAAMVEEMEKQSPYVPQYAAASMLKTSTPRCMREAMELL